MMIEINLLPEELKKKKGKKIRQLELSLPKISHKPVLIGVGAIFALVYLGVLTFSTLKNHSLNKLNTEWKSLQKQKEVLDKLKADIKDLETKNTSMGELVNNRFIWSAKLNQISDCLPEGVWLNSFSISKTKIAGRKKGRGAEASNFNTLEFRGSAAIPEGDEMLAIGKFIKNLKDDPSFIKDFENIELSSVQSTTSGKIEILDFTIRCFFKEDTEI